MNIILLIGAFIYGLMFGSFYNVCILRIPKGISIVYPPSHCPKCKNSIKWYQNIPIISYLFLKGRCYYCKTNISYIYPLIEFFSGIIAFMVAYYVISLNVENKIVLFIIYYIFCSCLLIISFIDIRFYIIPDRFTIGGVFVGILLSTCFPFIHGFSKYSEGFIHSSISALILYSVLFSIRFIGTIIYKREAMGYGDVKLVAAFGAFLGWKLALLSIFFGALFGTILGISFMILSKLKIKSEIPFGPYLAFGALVSLFFGDKFIAWYVNFNYIY